MDRSNSSWSDENLRALRATGRVCLGVWVCMALAASVLPQACYAAAITWDGSSSTEWNTAANWSSNSVPGSGDDVTIPTNVASARYPVVSTAAALAKTVTLATGAGTAPSLTVSADSLVVSGNFNIDAGTVTLSGGRIKETAGSMSVTGTFNVSGGTFLSSVTMTVNSGGNINVSGTGVVHMASGLATNPTDNLVIEAGGTVTQSGGTVDSKDLTTTSGSPDGTYNQSGGTYRHYHDFESSGTFNSTGGTIEFVAAPGGGTFPSSLGPTQFYNVINSVDPDFDNNVVSFSVAGDWTSNAAVGMSSKAVVVTFNGAGAQSIGGTSSTTFRNLTVNKSSGTVTLAGNQTVTSGNLSVTAGTLDLSSYTMNRSSSGGVITVSNGATLRIAGTNSFPSNYATHTLGSTSTVEYYGTSQTVTDEDYGHLILSGSGTKTMPGTAVAIAGNFTMSGTPTATAASALTVAGNFSAGTGCTFGGASYSHSVGGNFTNDGTFTGSTSTFTFNGSSAQAISGGSATTFNNLTLNNSNGLSLSTSATVSSAFTLTSGKLTLSTSNLTVGASGTISGASASNYIVTDNTGTLIRQTVGTTAVTYPVGIASSYLPATVKTASGTADFSYRVASAVSPALGSIETSVKRMWVLGRTAGAGNPSQITLQWNAGDEGSSFTRASSKSYLYSTSYWANTGSATLSGAGPYVSTITGLSTTGSYVQAMPYTIAGKVFEDVNYGGGAGRNWTTASGNGGSARSAARAELFDGGGNYWTSATTDGSGNYSFTDLASGSYLVRVVNSSVTSSRTGYSASCLPVMTFRTHAASGTAVDSTNYVGGQDPAAASVGNAGNGWILNGSTGVFSGSGSGTASAFSTTGIGAADITGVDFGFNFDTIVNTNDSGLGSLRQVIINADSLGGDASLAQSGLVAARENAVFMISNGTIAAGLRGASNYFAGGVATVSPTSAFPTISAPLVLDAQKQPGWSSEPIIELNGTNAGASKVGLTVSGGASIIRGFVINRFTSHGIYLITAGADTVQGNYVGTNSAGTAASANAGHGIFASNITNTLVGGTSATARNVVSGNNYGIVVAGAAAVGNTISGNYVGLNTAGTTAIANSIGIDVEGAATGNTVGGTSTAARNVISGNTQMGVLLQNAGTSSNTVAGNYVGTNATGAAALPNGTHGVNIKNSASGNTVGGTSGTAGNVISGNTRSGVAIEGAAASGNIVQGNYVGLNPAGTAAIANAAHGIYVTGSSNLIGGTATGVANVIAYNDSDGVAILGPTTSNRVAGNSIYSNTHLGIDVGDDGVTSSGAPVFTTVTPSALDFVVTTTVTAGDTVEFFRAGNASSPTVVGDASGRGEGYLYLGRCVDGGSCSGPYVAAAADGNPASGSVTATLLAAGIPVGDSVSAVAINPTSGSSEFSLTTSCPAVYSVAATTGAFSFGTSLANAWLTAQSSLLTNDGNVAANLVGQITQFTDGTNTWNVDGSNNGANTLRAQWSATSSTGPWTDIGAYDADFTVASAVAASGTATIWLRIMTPTTTTSYSQYASTLKVFAR